MSPNCILILSCRFKLVSSKNQRRLPNPNRQITVKRLIGTSCHRASRFIDLNITRQIFLGFEIMLWKKVHQRTRTNFKISQSPPKRLTARNNNLWWFIVRPDPLPALFMMVPHVLWAFATGVVPGNYANRLRVGRNEKDTKSRKANGHGILGKSGTKRNQGFELFQN